MNLKFYLIAAACENMGIGVSGNLPWRLKSEMAYFTRMTTTTSSPDKRNVVIMGRKTWESIPAKYKPLEGRINLVLSSQLLKSDLTDAVVCKSLEEAADVLCKPPYSEQVEKVWVIGGAGVYKAAMDSEWCDRIYLTRINQNFTCDTFFPHLDDSKFETIVDPEVPEGVQEEKGITFQYHVYQKI